jgi:hypothetical protein
MKTHKRWQKLADGLELGLKNEKWGEGKKPCTFVIIIMIEYKNKFKSVNIFANFCVS